MNLTNYYYAFFYKLFLLVFNLILTPFYFVKIVISFFVPKKISIVSLYEKLYDIDEKYKNIDENSMMTFMKQNIMYQGKHTLIMLVCS